MCCVLCLCVVCALQVGVARLANWLQHVQWAPTHSRATLCCAYTPLAPGMPCEASLQAQLSVLRAVRLCERVAVGGVEVLLAMWPMTGPVMQALRDLPQLPCTLSLLGCMWDSSALGQGQTAGGKAPSASHQQQQHTAADNSHSHSQLARLSCQLPAPAADTTHTHQQQAQCGTLKHIRSAPDMARSHTHNQQQGRTPVDYSCLAQHVPLSYVEWVVNTAQHPGLLQRLCAGISARREGLGLPPLRLRATRAQHGGGEAGTVCDSKHVRLIDFVL